MKECYKYPDNERILYFTSRFVREFEIDDFNSISIINYQFHVTFCSRVIILIEFEIDDSP